MAACEEMYALMLLMQSLLQVDFAKLSVPSILTANRPGGGARGGGGGGGSGAPQTRDVPLERVIDEVASMGFSRHEVRCRAVS